MPISEGGWRSLRRFFFLPLLGPMALLAGCVSVDGGGADAPRQVQVTSDLVTITGPDGFCVDPASTRADAETGFVILGNCAAISGSLRAPQPAIPAVLTAAVSAPVTGASLTENPGALDGFFQSEDGRQVLSRSGDAASVEILETRIVSGIFYLHARDTSGGALSGVAEDYWRAYLDVGTRLATLSVLALADQDVSDEAALATLSAFAAAISAANRGGGAAELPQAVAEPRPGPFTGGLIQRIFR